VTKNVGSVTKSVGNATKNVGSATTSAVLNVGSGAIKKVSPFSKTKKSHEKEGKAANKLECLSQVFKLVGNKLL